MGFATILVVGLLLTLIGIYKRKENYGKMFLVVGVLFILLTLYMVYTVKFKMTKGLE